MPARDGGAARRGPASANLQGRKPREGARSWRDVGYGDLRAAGEVCDWSRAGSASWPRVERLVNERRVALSAVNWRSICDDRWISERALPWPIERQRARRSDLRDCAAVMRCRP